MHIGLIPDGNRRYMKKKGIRSLLKSYSMGIQRFYDFVEWCISFGVREVTIYALSTENIENRGKKEVDTLYEVFADQAANALTDKRIHDNKIRVNVCGDKNILVNNGNTALGRKLVENLTKLEDATKHYSKVTLNLAVGYGGRQEILSAAQKTLSSGLPLTEENIKNNLWVKDYPDIIIRTSENRLSNFLLWQSAYSEIYFLDKLWQEFDKNDLSKILGDYNSRERRYGK